MKVYLVIGSDCEGASVLRAFDKPLSANACVERCIAYELTRPSAPPIVEDTPENDAEFDRYWKKFERWCKRHPGGTRANYYDSFTVMPVRVQP